ncbi:NEDD8 protease nep2 [Blomia tropicalis]|nr:NEDD8 protease nep2 [Blomia tropicalis]
MVGSNVNQGENVETNSSQWLNLMKNNLSNYFSKQPNYSRFDNEYDDVVTQSSTLPTYGSTTNHLCNGKIQSDSKNSIKTQIGNGHQCDHQKTKYNHSSLNLMDNYYKPIEVEQTISSKSSNITDLCYTKQDPVAVLDVSISTNYHCQTRQTLTNDSKQTQQHRQLLDKNNSTDNDKCTERNIDQILRKLKFDLTKTRSKGNKGQALKSNEFSVSQMKGNTNSFKSYSNHQTVSSTSSVAAFFSRQGKSFGCDRLKIVTAIMGTITLVLLMVFIVLIHALINGEAYIWNSQRGASVKGGGTNKIPAAQANRRICQTGACREAGKALYESINFTVNPCDDFFQYACGRWIEKNPIPDDKSRIGTFNKLDDQLNQEMRTILEDDVNNNKNRRMGSSDQLEETAKSVQFAKQLYHECMDRKTIEDLGSKPLEQTLSKLLGTQWPIVSIDEWNGREAHENWMEAFGRFYSYGHSPIVTFMVQADANQTTTNRIYVSIVNLNQWYLCLFHHLQFDSPSFGLGRKEYANQSSYATSVNAYRTYMHNVASHMAGPNVDRSMLDSRLKEIFDFESKLALASTPAEERRNAESWYNRMTLEQFKELTDYRVDWTQLIQTYVGKQNLSYQMSDSDLVIVEDVPYYQSLAMLFESTPDYVQFNYMGWLFAKRYSKLMGKELKNIWFENEKATQGVKKQIPIWQQCVKHVYDELNWAVSRMYIDRFVSPSTKQVAMQLIHDLKGSFVQIVNQDQWLDNITRKRSLDKLDGIVDNVAYPEWILNNDELDKFHGFTQNGPTVIAGKYFESILEVNQVSMRKMYEDLVLPVNLTLNWPMPPAMINAAYSPTQNSITIPVAILRPPFFDANRPMVLNFGGIGAIIGHEITHGFDDQGQQFDKKGNLINWWTDETKLRFTSGAKCFIDQYGSIVDSIAKKNLNGVNTVGENIADNGGVREAFMAFQERDSHRMQALVPYLTKFTPEQLFFLSYASNWCGSIRPKKLQIMIDYDPHSPINYRVNVPLSNFDQFAKAFSCPIGSPMNPTNKCNLW